MKKLYAGCIILGLVSTLLMNQSYAQTETHPIKTKLNDSAITALIKSEFGENNLIDSQAITVTTDKGIVTLTGTVNSETEAEQAIEISESITGVKDVNTDNFYVKDSTQPMTDTYITAKVKGLFVRESLLPNNTFPAAKIKVETKDGILYLSGEVANKNQEKNAIDIAHSVSGVKKVISVIQVK